MGLDVYVGSLARYYLGDWETVIQQFARKHGHKVEIRRPPQPPRSVLRRLADFITRSRTGPDAAANAVARWRRALGKASGLGDSFDWNENPAYEYFTDKPAWDCYGGLVLWACYDELPKAKRAQTALEWRDDSAYRTALSLPRGNYPHLVADTEIWFPIEFEEPFQVTSITGQPMLVGSSIRLVGELEKLNERTWRADNALIEQWRADGAEYGADLEKSAQLGFAVFYELAMLSIQHRLPMKLDY